MSMRTYIHTYIHTGIAILVALGKKNTITNKNVVQLYHAKYKVVHSNKNIRNDLIFWILF